MKNHPHTALAAFCVLALAGCSGGGGGSSSASNPVVTPPPAVGLSVPFQTPGTTVTYQVDSAAAVVMNGLIANTTTTAEGNGSTVTLTTDASGNLAQLSYNTPTPGAPFTNTYSNFNTSTTLSLGTLSAALIAIGQTVGANGGANFTGGLSYGKYGIWGINDTGSGGRIGVYGFGATTPTGAVPTTGTATYTGSTVGFGSDTANSYAVLGGVVLNANFGTHTVLTTISVPQIENLNNLAVLNGFTLNGSSTIAGSHYAGTLSGGAYSGTQTGTFNGPAANETTGIWRVSGAGATFIGSYGAKQ